jgi:hypothetical protein
MESEKYPYQKDWEEYRKRRNLCFSIFISIFIFLPLIGMLSRALSFDLKQNYGVQYVLAAPWIIGCFISLSKFNTWNCPRCGKQFFTYSFWITSPIFQSNCGNCKLPKYKGSTFYK